ncbi:MAG: hypothetical protein HPY75_04275 [Actinobacteria bacterium]|nr:hypothetical protein [Actinomycetota bacterium]
MNVKICLGPLTRKILTNAPWVGQDDFPSSQEWADFIERLLTHIKSQGQFEHYSCMLCSDISQRDSAFSEILASYFFKRKGFTILNYDPNTKNHVDLEIQWRDSPIIYCEVKNPGWEGELSDAEKLGARKRMPKYVSGEARSINPTERIFYAIEKAREKFPEHTPNLVVVVPDLFVSVTEKLFPPMEKELKELISKKDNRIIGGVILIEAINYGRGVQIFYLFLENENANVNNRLPVEVVKGLASGSFTGFDGKH